MVKINYLVNWRFTISSFDAKAWISFTDLSSIEFGFQRKLSRKLTEHFISPNKRRISSDPGVLSNTRILRSSGSSSTWISPGVEDANPGMASDNE